MGNLYPAHVMGDRGLGVLLSGNDALAWFGASCPRGIGHQQTAEHLASQPVPLATDGRPYTPRLTGGG